MRGWPSSSPTPSRASVTLERTPSPKDIRELTNDPEAYAAELERRWTGLLSYRSMQRYAEVVRDAVHDRLVPPDAPTFDDGLACALVMDRVGR